MALASPKKFSYAAQNLSGLSPEYPRDNTNADTGAPMQGPGEAAEVALRQEC